MQINFWARVEKDGYKVKGHLNRCLALADMLCNMGYEIAVHTAEPAPSIDEINIIDGYSDPANSKSEITIVIDDYPHYSTFGRVDLLINPGWPNVKARGAVKEIVSGLQQAAVIDHSICYREPVPLDERYGALVVSGGNSEAFTSVYRSYELNNVTEIIEDKAPKEDFVELLACAELVICTPSTTAVEAAVLGTPMMLVITAEDQYGIHNQLTKNNAAVLLNDNNLELIQDKNLRINMIRNALQCVNPNSTFSIALKIHQIIQEKLK